jgi:sortase A
MKRVALLVCAVILLVAGMIATCLPFFIDTSYQNKQKASIEKFIQDCSETAVIETLPDVSDITSKHKVQKAVSIKRDLKRLRRDIVAYNKRIYKEKQCNLKDKSSYQVASLNLSNYGFQDNIYGYLTIDKMNLSMPIYLGANDYNMSLGAAHMSQTSIPYGGDNTHAVIAGHCGYGYMNYFRYIDSLQNGDDVKVTTPFGQLEYRVSNKVIIKPSEFEPLRIKKGKDLLTLFTCYPYPTNKYRCCVICERSLNE